jgi:hypothetical protein
MEKNGDHWYVRLDNIESPDIYSIYLISLALESGYAEEVKEQWQAWERRVMEGGYYGFGYNRCKSFW